MQSLVWIIIAMALSEGYGLTSDELTRQCYHKWYNVPQGSMNDAQQQCSRYKAVSDCWASKTVDSSIFVDKARFFVQQQAIFCNKLICDPEIGVSELTKLVDLSGMKEKYKSIVIDNDEPAQCAADAYLECLRPYDREYPNGKICQAEETFILCIKDKTKTCKADILQHFSHIFSKELVHMFAKNAALMDICNRG